MPAPIGAALATSVVLHAALLGVMAPGGEERTGSDQPVAAVEVRLSDVKKTADAPAAAVPVKRAQATVPFVGPSPKKYFTSAELDERATPVEMAPLVYPETAYVNRIRGTVRMRIFISEAGTVEGADVIAASPTGHFEQAALDAVRRTQFRPGMKAGRAVASQKIIEVEFDPYGPTPEEGGR